MRRLAPLAVLLLSSFVAACGGGGGGGGSASVGNGTVSVSLTDGPACGFDAVNVTISRIRIHASSTANEGDGGWTDIPLTPPRRLDLLTLTNGVLATLGQATLPVGDYTQIRLVLQPTVGNALTNSITPTGAAEQPLDTPSGVQTGIKLVTRFSVLAGQQADVLLDFDACRSIVARGNGTWLMKPVLRVTPVVNAGRIAGNVDLAAATAGARITAQKGGTIIRSTVSDATGAFILGALPAADGPWDVVMTAPGRAPAILRGVAVTANGTSRVSPAASFVTLATSPTQVVSGTITPASALPTVRALHVLDPATRFETGFANADATGAYTMTLPTAAPAVATWSSAATSFTFVPQSALAGQYTLEASADGYQTQTVTGVSISAGNVTRSFTLQP
jgi:hypothetical protein